MGCPWPGQLSPPAANDANHPVAEQLIRLGVFRDEIRRGAEQVGGHQNLSVAVFAGTDSDGWNVNQARDLSRDGRCYELEHDAERARLAKRAIAQWNDLPGDATGDAVLIDPDRQLMETAIQALLKNRDDRPVTIKE